MSLRKQGLVLAMENDDSTEEENAPMLPKVDEALLDAEEASEEVSEQVAEVEELEDSVEDAESDAGTLEEIKGTMERSVEEGEGLTETAAEIAEVAVEAICARLGMPSHKVMPAMESFGSTGSRLTATKVSVENIKDTIMTIINAVIKAVKSVAAKIVAFFSNLNSNAVKMSKYIDTLLVKAKALDADAKPKEATLDKKGVAKAFSVDKKADGSTADVILENSETLISSIKAVSTAVSSTVMTSILSSVNSGGNTDSLTAASGQLKTKVDAIMGKLSVISESIEKISDDQEAKTVERGALAGGKTLQIKTVSLGDNIETITVKVKSIAKFEAAEKITALNKDETIALLTSAKSLCGKIVDVTKDQKEVKDITKSLTKASESMAKKLGKGLEGDEAKEFKFILKYIRNTNSMIASLAGTLPGTAFGAVKAAGEYANVSMANMKKEEASS